MANFGAEKPPNWHKLAQILKYHCKIWYKFPDCGTTSIDREWWLLFPVCLWLVAVISFSFWMVAWMAAVISWGLLGTMEICIPRVLEMAPREMASDLQIPRHDLAHFRCAKFCHSKLRLLLIFSFPGITKPCHSRRAVAVRQGGRPVDLGGRPILHNFTTQSA